MREVHAGAAGGQGEAVNWKQQEIHCPNCGVRAVWQDADDTGDYLLSCGRTRHAGAQAVSGTIRTVDPAALFNIPEGTVMTFVDGRTLIRRSTWTERARHRLRRAIKRALWWRETRYVVIAASDGVVTMAGERWSWLRLRWLREDA